MGLPIDTTPSIAEGGSQFLSFSRTSSAAVQNPKESSEEINYWVKRPRRRLDDNTLEQYGQRDGQRDGHLDNAFRQASLRRVLWQKHAH